MSKVISDVKSAAHRVAEGTPVKVRAIIGNGQLGGWVMLKSGEHVAGGSHDHWVDLGDGSTLKGHHLEVSVSIQDVRRETDRLSLIVEVSGAENTTVTIAHDGAPGDRAAYLAFIIFQ